VKLCVSLKRPPRGVVARPRSPGCCRWPAAGMLGSEGACVQQHISYMCANSGPPRRSCWREDRTDGVRTEPVIFGRGGGWADVVLGWSPRLNVVYSKEKNKY